MGIFCKIVFVRRQKKRFPSCTNPLNGNRFVFDKNSKRLNSKRNKKVKRTHIKSHISRIENNSFDKRLSIMMKIIQTELSVRLKITLVL